MRMLFLSMAGKIVLFNADYTKTCAIPLKTRFEGISNFFCSILNSKLLVVNDLYAKRSFLLSGNIERTKTSCHSGLESEASL